MPASGRNLFLFIKIFGKIDGILLAFKYKFDFLNDLTIPGIKTKINLRRDTTDKATFFQVFLKRQYSMRFPIIPQVVIDGGANIGLFTLMIKNKFPCATIICIEPDPENFLMLQKNLVSYPNVFFENSGLWKNDGFLKIYDKHNKGKSAITVEEDPNGEIKGITIDAIMNKYAFDHIDILKLDIEGSEKYIFSDNFQSWLSKTKIIMIELHDQIEAGCSKAFFQALNHTIKSYSYSNCGETVIIINNDLF